MIERVETTEEASAPTRTWDVRLAGNVRAVQRRLRHGSASFALETYIHLLDDRAGVDAVAEALDDARG